MKFVPLEVYVDFFDNYGDLIKNLVSGNFKQLKDLAQAIDEDQSTAFSLLFRFTLSENISQVRVTKRKNWNSTMAEMIGFIGGLSFIARITKYLLGLYGVFSSFDAIVTDEEDIKLLQKDPVRRHIPINCGSSRELELGAISAKSINTVKSQREFRTVKLMKNASTTPEKINDKDLI